jgi:hypothetical protein
MIEKDAHGESLFYEISASGTYDGTSIGERAVITGESQNITVNGHGGSDYIKVSSLKSNININAGEGNDYISASIIGPGGSFTHNGNLISIDRRENHTVIDGGDGYDVLNTNFTIDPNSTVTLNEDGSYTIQSGNDIITLKNIEEIRDDEGGIIELLVNT